MAGDAGVVLLFVWHESLSRPVLKTCIRLCTIFLYECCGFFCAVWTRMFLLSGLWCHNVKGIEGRVLAMKYIVVRKIYPGIVKVRTGLKRLSWNVSTCIWMYFKHLQAFYSCGVSATNRSNEMYMEILCVSIQSRGPDFTVITCDIDMVPLIL